MRLPFVTRKRFEDVKAERDDMARRLRSRKAGEVTVKLRADTSEFEAALERVKRMTGAGDDEIALMQRAARRRGEHR